MRSTHSIPTTFYPRTVEALIQRLIETVDELRRRIDADLPPQAEPRSPADHALTPIEVGQRLRKSRAWVYQRMADGSLPFCQVSARRRLVRQQDLDAFLISRRG